jgi:hypothetical protein
LPSSITAVYVSIFNTFIELHILTELHSYDPDDIYQACETEEVRFQALLSWSHIATVDHFVTMFHFFESFVNVQLANEIRQVSECLRIPADLPDGGELC